VIVGRDDEDARQAVALAAAVGITEVAGYLAGGMTSWREEKRPVERVTRLTVDEFHERWESDRHSLQLLDVRERAEWEDGHVPGAVHKPYHDISRVPQGIDPDRPVAVVCGSGQRQGWPVDSPGTTAA